MIVMPRNHLSKNIHLFWRAGFGPSVEAWEQLAQVPPTKYYDALVKASAREPQPIVVVDNALEGLLNGLDSLRQLQQMSAEERRQRQQLQREGIRNLNLRWMEEMVNSPQQLREKMALFWHGHFACRNFNALYQQQLLHVLRKHALGNFGTLLKEVSRSAAMLAFLNNQQNRKQRPNENFARELMELFTLGRGHYTEKDVREAARAFTGWQFKVDGEFVFREQLHDFGTKTILGRTGNWDGEDVLNILLEQRQTAVHITSKLYRYLVNDEVDVQRVQQLADVFYKSRYDIGTLLRSIFTSDWFYQEKNIGARVKSPIELLVGIRRMVPLEFQNPEVLLLYQRITGQILFYPPNVAGWPGGQNWIDSSTLMFRMRIPQLLLGNDAVNIRPKADDDQMMGRPESRRNLNRQAVATANWEFLFKATAQVSRSALLPMLTAYLWPATAKPPLENVLAAYLDTGSREKYTQTAMLCLMCMPEYQLC